MRILLIKPKQFVDGDVYRFKDLQRIPPLGLGIIAALSKGHEVRIIDEDIEKIEYTSDWDLVGITVVTFTSIAAYRISENFRRLRVKTILGGPHPSILPEEAINYCDSVVIGEAEPVWGKILKDFAENKLQKIYNGNYVENLDDVPIPRRDLFSKKYFITPIQFTRGCSNNCFYCYLQSVPWKKYRKKSPGKIYEEISQISNKYFFVIDDNIFIDREYVKAVVKKITPLKKAWSIQAPTIINKDEEMLDLMVKSGCFSVIIGFQSVNQDSLNHNSIKHHEVNEYKKIVEVLHKKGILVGSTFIFGFDQDNRNTFKYTVEMIKEINLDDVIIYILTPYPGTELFKKFEKEGRILNYDWSKYSWYNCNFQPKGMDANELEEGYRQVYEELNRYFRKTLIKRVWSFRKRYLKDLFLGTVILRNTFNRVKVARLP